LADRFNYYVWYRVNQDDRDTETAIRGMMARLGCRSGVPGRLLKKRGEPGLWMETYEGVEDPARFERTMDQVVVELDVEMFLDGARRTECFVADDPLPAACAAAG
jgi:hypothetical protein